MRKISGLVGATVLLTAGLVGAAETVELEPVADVTLYEESGQTANGAGSYIFVGRTENRNGAVERRALLRFDIGASVPSGASITEARLEVTMSRTISGAQTVELRKVLESWGEGTSDAPGQEGGGTGATPGDATWSHRELPSVNWSSPGGVFAQDASASQQIAGTGPYTFDSTAGSVADVQGWLDDPGSNFGWALVMPSPAVGGAKRFNSRENSNDSSRPKLVVTFEAADDAPELTERYPFPASNAGGSGGSFFVTTVDILNADDDTASIRMQRLERDADNSGALESALFTLEPGEVRRFDNVLGEAFGTDGEDFAGGAAVLSDSDDLLVVTRTFDNSGDGTKGAALPARPADEMVAAGQRAAVLFLTENSAFRSNLGLLSNVDFEITVQWELFASDGTSLGTGSRVLPPFGVTQVNRILRPFQPIEAAYAEVWTQTAGGLFTAYGAVIDQVSQDPTLVVVSDD
jgi:hypothetical protein